MRIGGVERRLGRVELGLERAQRLDHLVRRLDRVGARLGASPAWAGAPSTRTWNHSTPTWAFQIAPFVGSVRMAASAVWPASTQASAPLPVHSSSTTDCSWTRPRGADAQPLQGAHGADHRDEAGLHVAGAAAVHPVAVAARRRTARRSTARSAQG